MISNTLPVDVNIKYKPPKYTPEEVAEFTKYRAKNGPDYRFCRNDKKFPSKTRMMRKIMVGITIQDDNNNDIFLLFNVEYGWHSKPQTNGGLIEIVRTELAEINEMQPSNDELLKYRDSFKGCEEFKRNLIEADYYKYG